MTLLGRPRAGPGKKGLDVKFRRVYKSCTLAYVPGLGWSGDWPASFPFRASPWILTGIRGLRVYTPTPGFLDRHVPSVVRTTVAIKSIHPLILLPSSSFFVE